MSKTAADYRTIYQDKSTTLQVLAATDDQVSFIAPKSAAHQLYIQRISVMPTTYSAKTWDFQDTNGTPVPVGHISIPAAAPTAAGDASFVLDYGAAGVALTVGAGLTLNVSAAGAAAMVRVEAYQKIVNAAAGSTN